MQFTASVDELAAERTSREREKQTLQPCNVLPVKPKNKRIIYYFDAISYGQKLQ